MAKTTASGRWSAEKESVFLSILQQSGNVTAATAAAELDRSQVYRRRVAHPAFRDKWQAAMDQALDHLEAYLWDKALGATGQQDRADGGKAPVIDEKVAIFLLKAHRPEIFGDGKRRPTSLRKGKTLSPRARLLKKLDQMGDHAPTKD
ncbi:hypothetical protein [Paremcibacter congregatus]|uniref:Terminase n=1 Tax=Paremcibacter congregatus TaxID=2043170 RepID=A0A2G4YRF7_9PROT|nr:hypothetical protein [Paremcibacter congregatus]PHZ84903.1 hypothetical protein CRD36_09260 [Paremcibacter congregatus]QDE26123.1 hypothetical protein FIV45_01885 [Paremcibacter congregatus]